MYDCHLSHWLNENDFFEKKKQLPKKFKVLGNEKKYPKYNKFTNKYCLADMWLLHLQNW